VGRPASSQRNVNPSAPIRDYLDALVHPSVRADALIAVRHRAFMAPRLFGSLVALGALPIYLVWRGTPSVLELVVLAWIIVPIGMAYFLSRTGRYEAAHILSAVALTVIVTALAANSGGIHSFAAIWLVLIPVEAAASSSRRVVAVAALLALGSAAFLILAGSWLAMLPPAEGAAGTLAALGIVSASLYTTGIALGADSVARAHSWEALIEARAEAERANAAKSRFLAVVSHELRTPLNAIIGFSQMLGNDAEIRVEADRRREYARLINDSGSHLLAVVNDMLDMARLETGDFEINVEPFRLAAVVTSCEELLALKAHEAGIALCCEADAELPDIVADKRAVKQILINLISNAIKFTERGGTVNVAARIDGPHVLLAVEDTGIGIAADDLARIGDPFYQARGNYARRHDGTGLGLSIVKGLVGLHGGELEIRSRPGHGTSILVRLPRDGQRTAAPAGTVDAAGTADVMAPFPVPAWPGASQRRAELRASTQPRAAVESSQHSDRILQKRA
jgi:signal transduction histidine kinase